MVQQLGNLQRKEREVDMLKQVQQESEQKLKSQGAQLDQEYDNNVELQKNIDGLRAEVRNVRSELE